MITEKSEKNPCRQAHEQSEFKEKSERNSENS